MMSVTVRTIVETFEAGYESKTILNASRVSRLTVEDLGILNRDYGLAAVYNNIADRITITRDL